jgi:hypothetical protein
MWAFNLNRSAASTRLRFENGKIERSILCAVDAD